LALGAVVFERKDKFVALLPTVLCEELATGSEIVQRRSVSSGGLGAPAGDQVKFGDTLAFLLALDLCGAAIELVHDLEDILLDLLGCSPRRKRSADTKMSRRALPLGDQCIGRLLHTIV